MITLKEWMEIVNYRITEGWQHQWKCYGDDAQGLDSTIDDQCSICIIFRRNGLEVCEVQAHDYVNNRAYRMINPDYQHLHDQEAKDKSVNVKQAWDDVEFIDLDVDDDFIQKALSIVAGETYDTRVQVPVEFSDEELLKYMKLAHERDITFNQLVEEALRAAIEESKL